MNVVPFAAELYKPTIPSILFPIFAIVWILIFLLLSVYDGRKNLYAVDEFASISLGSLLAAVFLAGLLYFTYRDVSRLLFIVFIIIAFLIMLVWRIIVRLSFNLRRTNAIRNRRVLLIRAGPVGRDLENRIAQYPYLGLHIVGFLDDDQNKRQSEIEIGGFAAGYYYSIISNLIVIGATFGWLSMILLATIVASLLPGSPFLGPGLNWSDFDRLNLISPSTRGLPYEYPAIISGFIIGALAGFQQLMRSRIRDNKLYSVNSWIR